MPSDPDLARQLDGVNAVELRSVALAEFVLDSADTPSLDIDGSGSHEVAVSVNGSTLRIEGSAPAPQAGIRAQQVSGSYVTGTEGLASMVSAGSDPLRIRTGSGDLRIRLALRPGSAVTIRSDYGTYSTRSPLGEEARKERRAEKADSREAKASGKRDALLQKAEAKRARAQARQREATEAEAAGKPEKAARRRDDAATALKQAEDYERQAAEAYEALMREASELRE
ncbi:MAG TPA: hypothetical protein VF701_08285 [Thermoanaerobaculia bacterium]